MTAASTPCPTNHDAIPSSPFGNLLKRISITLSPPSPSHRRTVAVIAILCI